MGPSQKRALPENELSILEDAVGGRPPICLHPPEFVIGRNVNASLNIPNVTISRTHCILKYSENLWLLCDKSSFGTHLNGEKLTKDKDVTLKNGDKIQLGPTDLFVFTYCVKNGKMKIAEPELKKIKREADKENDNISAVDQSLEICAMEFGSKKSDEHRLAEKLKLELMNQSHLEEKKLELERSFNEKLIALKERQNLEREELFSQQIVSDLNHDLQAKALEQRLYEEQRDFETRLKKEMDELQLKIMESKQVEENLMEQNQNLLTILEQERGEFQRRLEAEQKHLLEKQVKEKQLTEEKEQVQKKLLQEKEQLERRLKEMQSLLAEKEVAQEEMNKKLFEKEEERLRDLKHLQEMQDAHTKSLLQQVNEREHTLRKQLETEIWNLQEERMKIEENIRGEMSKREGESVESLKKLERELEKVKKDLNNTEGKKQFLEKELEQTNRAKEDASVASLKARQDVLQNVGELMETELQCSICSELFVLATTLNCTHTFCRFCILEWKKKKKDCPVCRTPIKTETRSIVLDSFIDRMVGSLTEDLKRRRQELVEERQVIELLEGQPKPKGKTRGRRNEVLIPVNSASSSGTDISRYLLLPGIRNQSTSAQTPITMTTRPPVFLVLVETPAPQ